MIPRTVLITGGRGRIGGMITFELLSRGTQVIVIDKAPIASDSPSATHVTHLTADLADEDQARQAFDSLARSHPRIDGAVLAAGDFCFGPFVSATSQELRRLFRNNVLTAFLSIQHLVPLMRDQGGHIILMGSIVDHRVVRGNAVYASSKAALRMLGEIVREELKDLPIRFTNLSLGAVASPMADRIGDPSKAKSLLHPKNVADSVLWLLAAPLEPRFDELRLFPSVGVNDP